ncbi:hypothetical protein BIV57_07710, partial [Mangrovactinospora gilvigrisea]
DGPRVIDFGIARALDETALTVSGQVIGTPGFLSPEQARGHAIGPGADQFCLGLILAHACSGTHPFGVGRLPQMLYRIVYEAADLSAVPDGLRPTVAALLARAPEERPGPEQVLAQLQVDASDGDEPWLPPAFLDLVLDRMRLRMAGVPEATAPEAVAAPAAAVGFGPPEYPAPEAEAVPVPEPEPEPERQLRAAPAPEPEPAPGPAPAAERPPRVTRRAVMTAALAGAAGISGFAAWRLTAAGASDAGSSGGSAVDRAADVTPAAAAPAHAWDVALPAVGALAVSGDTVLVGHAKGLDAVRISARKTAWSATLRTGGAVSSLAVSGGRAYIGTMAGEMVAADVRTGRQLWKHRMVDPVEVFAVAPTSDAVYFGCADGFVHCFGLAPSIGSDGMAMERYMATLHGNATGLSPAPGGVYVADYHADAPNEDALWLVRGMNTLSREFQPGGDGMYALDRSGPDRMLVGTGRALTLLDLGTMQPAAEWKRSFATDGAAQRIAVSGGTAFVGTPHSVAAVALADGTGRWKAPHAVGAGGALALCPLGGVVCVGGRSALISVDARSGAALGRYPLAGPVAALDAAGGALYAGHGGGLSAFRAA